MTHDDYERGLDQLARDVLAAFVELRRETDSLRPEERMRREQGGYRLLRVAWAADPDITTNIRQRVLSLARSLHDEVLASWLDDLFDRCAPESDPARR